MVLLDPRHSGWTTNELYDLDSTNTALGGRTQLM